MNFLQALLLGVVEGVTEFLPVSSTGHLTIVEKLLGLAVEDPGVTAFTAIVQVGAIAACILYFRRDIVALATVWFRGLRDSSARSEPRYRLAWYVIAGSVPIGVVGFAGRHVIAGNLRNLWVVVAALIGWSVVMLVAERRGRQDRGERDLRLRDALVVGMVQCVALVPGVSRSGATISAGLLRGIDRLTATRLSFFLAIPALLAAGGFEAATAAPEVAASVGWASTLAGTAVSFLTAYASIAWLLRLLTRHPITVFVSYRVGLALIVAVLLATNLLASS
jgi:undecaprenyl-diphosphatase